MSNHYLHIHYDGFMTESYDPNSSGGCKGRYGDVPSSPGSVLFSQYSFLVAKTEIAQNL